MTSGIDKKIYLIFYLQIGFSNVFLDVDIARSVVCHTHTHTNAIFFVYHFCAKKKIYSQQIPVVLVGGAAPI